MSTGSTDFSDPQFNAEYIEPVAVERPIKPGSEIWAEIDEAVQKVLASLDEPVRSKVADLQVTAGRTQGRGFYLFSYRTFSRSDDEQVDPVVVGMTFTPADNGPEGTVAIDADISGESTGDSIVTIARRTVPVTREELLRAALELANELSGLGQAVGEALVDVSRRT